jgi:phosphoadenosine phosphosulfate reductase
VRTTYDIPIETYFPQPEAVQKLVAAKGCSPSTAMATRSAAVCARSSHCSARCGLLNAWITGQRRDQSPGTRAAVPVVQNDPTFGSDTHTAGEVQPVANWTSQQVWDYIRSNDVPYNALHERGFISIGCEPCTRAVAPRARTRRPLVVGERDHEGMRPARGEREVGSR